MSRDLVRWSEYDREYKVVFVAHPLRGNVEGNIKEVVQICKAIHSESVIPIAPYVLDCQYLRDGLEEERKLGITTNLLHFTRGFVDELWLYGDNLSEGMLEEVECCEALSIPVIPKTMETQEAMLERINASARNRDPS